MSSSTTQLPRVTLCAAVTELPRMTAIVKVCSAVGISEIVPTTTDRTTDSDIVAWQDHIAGRGSSSGGRGTSAAGLPEAIIREVTPMLDMVESSIRNGAAVIVLWEESTQPTLVDLVDSLNESSEGADWVVLVVGPRLGLTRSEVDAAVSLGAHTATIGSEVVGNHIAAVAGVVIVREALESRLRVPPKI